jgi:hypothetical protein
MFNVCCIYRADQFYFSSDVRYFTMLTTYQGAAGVHPNTYILNLLLNIHSMLEVFLSIIPAYK